MSQRFSLLDPLIDHLACSRSPIRGSLSGLLELVEILLLLVEGGA
jgi:hypothetical protein